MTAQRAGTDALARELGYTFSNHALLESALTHNSVEDGGAASAFQRLEFLGDRVLSLVVAHILHDRFPNAPEGELARRFNDLVREEALADVAREIGLGRHLALGKSELRAGGRNNDAILADACEALLAAVFLDGGMAVAHSLIVRLWGSRLDRQAEPPPRDPKTALQEWSQARGTGLPEYVETGREGPDHAPSFSVEVRVSGFVPAQGAGGSKREAERNAARAFIEREAVDVG